jgi:hypothetical protein
MDKENTNRSISWAGTEENKMNLKSHTMHAIENGLNNKQISLSLNAKIGYVYEVRSRYNAIAIKPMRSSVNGKPREGTMSRAVYDALAANPSATSRAIIDLTGACYGVIQSVKINYFGYKASRVQMIRQPVSMRTVELSELTP